jgi:hypothetical protein
VFEISTEINGRPKVSSGHHARHIGHCKIRADIQQIAQISNRATKAIKQKVICIFSIDILFSVFGYIFYENQRVAMIYRNPISS